MATGTIPKYMDGTDTGWLSYTNSSVFSGTIYYRKIGNILAISTNGWIKLNTNLSAKSNRDLAGNNPFPIIPEKSVVFMGFINSGYVSNRYLPLRLNTDGSMQIYSGVDEVESGYNLAFSGVAI